MDSFNGETGEVFVPAASMAMPVEIAKAIVAVSSKVKMLGTDTRNEHGKYNYVSIDKFLEVLGPVMAEAGLILTQDEVAAEVRPLADKSYLFCRYAFGFSHISGATWGPVYRSVALQALGPQSFGAAESYMMKRFLRGIFMVPTGDQDADAEAQNGIERQPQSRAAPPARTFHQAPKAAPPPTPDRAAAQEKFRGVRAEIDASMTVPEIEHLPSSGMWVEMEKAVRAAETKETADELISQLTSRLAKRHDMIMGEGDYR